MIAPASLSLIMKPRMGKRLFDVVLASALLLMFLPLFLLISLVILVTSGRPIFFRQKRAGYHGHPFEIIKFRTLHTGPHDPRNPEAHVIPAGRLLRRFALDELPQLWNIVWGEMSLIGPRPILLEEAHNYDERERHRLDTRPGLTGWAQVNGRNALSWHQRIELDLWYVDHQSFWLDLRILARTPGALLSGKGVYGLGNLDPDDHAFAAHRGSAPDTPQE